MLGLLGHACKRCTSHCVSHWSVAFMLALQRGLAERWLAALQGLGSGSRVSQVGVHYAGMCATCHCSVALAASTPLGMPSWESSYLEPTALSTPLSQSGSSAVCSRVFAQGFYNMQVGACCRHVQGQPCIHHFCDKADGSTCYCPFPFAGTVSWARGRCMQPVFARSTSFCDICCRRAGHSRLNTTDTTFILIFIFGKNNFNT